MTMEDGRTRARLAVHAEMAQRGWTNTELSRLANIDIATASDFLSGERWPKTPTQGRIEKALGWAPGTMAGIVAGVAPPTIGAVAQEDALDGGESLLYRRPEGLTDREWDRIRAEGLRFIKWQIDQAARER